MFYKKVFFTISQTSQENTRARVSFFNKVAGLKPAALLKKETLAQVFFCEYCEIFIRTPFLQNNFGRLLA